MKKDFLLSDENTNISFLSRFKKKIFFVALAILKTIVAVFLIFVVVFGARMLYEFYYSPEARALWNAAEKAQESYRRNGNVVIYEPR